MGGNTSPQPHGSGVSHQPPTLAHGPVLMQGHSGSCWPLLPTAPPSTLWLTGTEVFLVQLVFSKQEMALSP